MDELEDMPYNSTKPRRRSNAGSNALRTKFEVEEEQPVFEEEIHGATAPDFQHEEMEKLSKQSTTSSEESVDDKE